MSPIIPVILHYYRDSHSHSRNTTTGRWSYAMRPAGWLVLLMTGIMGLMLLPGSRTATTAPLYKLTSLRAQRFGLQSSKLN